MPNPSIITYIENCLKEILRNKQLKIGEPYPSRGEFSIMASLGLDYITDHDGHRIGLIPFKVTADVTYWLSVFIQYNYSEEELRSISIGFYDDTKSTLFRAEWDKNKHVVAHAQPHWHVHNKSIPKDSPFLDKEIVANFPKDADKLMGDVYKKIHFSMSTTWDKSPNIVRELPSKPQNEIVDWIRGVFMYTKGQLTYLHDKEA